ncbi:unnamed protein product [Prunus armeniaca]
MPTEDSHDTQHHTPCGDTSRRKPSADANLQAEPKDPRVAHLGPLPKPTHLPAGKGVGDSDNWESYHPEDLESYHTEAFEEWEPYLTPAHPHTRPSALETLPHADPAMRLLFEKVRRLESKQQRSHQPLWAKPRPGPFTNRILNYHQEKDIQSLRNCLLHWHGGSSHLYPLLPVCHQTDRLYSADDLYMLWQGEDEPLREYVARFSHEYSRCPETDDRAAFDAFKSGLRQSNFRYLVHSNSWNTYVELIKQVAVHTKAEYFNFKRGPATPAHSTFGDPPPASIPTQSRLSILLLLQIPRVPHPKRKDNYQHTFSSSKSGRHGNHQQSSGSNPPGQVIGPHSSSHPKPRFEVFTTLNTTYENVLMHEAPMIPKPPPGDRPASLCQTQVSSIAFIRKLDKYVHNLPFPPPPNPHQRQINMISTISGGPNMAGTSNNSIKHYVCSTYAYQVFSTEAPTLGSLARLKHHPSRELLWRCCSAPWQHPPSYPIGSVPQRAIVTTSFLIVDCPTTFNVILGCPALAKMKVFISTHILLLKFPTPHGTSTVRGDQFGARSCYASVVKSTNRQHRCEALAVNNAAAPHRAGTE